MLFEQRKCWGDYFSTPKRAPCMLQQLLLPINAIFFPQSNAPTLFVAHFIARWLSWKSFLLSHILAKKKKDFSIATTHGNRFLLHFYFLRCDNEREVLWSWKTECDSHLDSMSWKKVEKLVRLNFLTPIFNLLRDSFRQLFGHHDRFQHFRFHPTYNSLWWGWELK